MTSLSSSWPVTSAERSAAGRSRGTTPGTWFSSHSASPFGGPPPSYCSPAPTGDSRAWPARKRLTPTVDKEALARLFSTTTTSGAAFRGEDLSECGRAESFRRVHEVLKVPVLGTLRPGVLGSQAGPPPLRREGLPAAAREDVFARTPAEAELNRELRQLNQPAAKHTLPGKALLTSTYSTEFHTPVRLGRRTPVVHDESIGSLTGSGNLGEALQKAWARLREEEGQEIPWAGRAADRRPRSELPAVRQHTADRWRTQYASAFGGDAPAKQTSTQALARKRWRPPTPGLRQVRRSRSAPGALTARDA